MATTEEILGKIKRYKDAMDSESDAGIKKKFEDKILALEKDLKGMQSTEEKKEVVAIAEEKKELSAAENKLQKYKDAVAAETDPDVKARFQKKVDALTAELSGVKQEIKEDKKEADDHKKEIAQAVKEVKSSDKKVRGAAVKKIAGKSKAKKKIEAKKAARKQKLKKMLSELDMLIENNKKLRGKYAGKKVDLDRDAGRPSKPFGYRFKGKHDYRTPTPAQVSRGLRRGKIDYENRPNRADVFPKGYKKKEGLKLAKGGKIDAAVAKANKEKDEQRFAKPSGYRWKNIAVKKGVIKKGDLSKTPSKQMRDKYPAFIDFESRPSKSDKKPSRKYISL